MAFQYTPNKIPMFPVEIFREGVKKPVVFEIPFLGYVAPEIHEEVDRIITERIFEVQRVRDERNKNREPLPEMDKRIQYPRQTEVMQELFKRLNPDLAEETAAWPITPLNELWDQWEKASLPADLEKSEASEPSSEEKA